MPGLMQTRPLSEFLHAVNHRDRLAKQVRSSCHSSSRRVEMALVQASWHSSNTMHVIHHQGRMDAFRANKKRKSLFILQRVYFALGLRVSMFFVIWSACILFDVLATSSCIELTYRGLTLEVRLSIFSFVTCGCLASEDTHQCNFENA